MKALIGKAVDLLSTQRADQATPSLNHCFPEDFNTRSAHLESRLATGSSARSMIAFTSSVRQIAKRVGAHLDSVDAHCFSFA